MPLPWTPAYPVRTARLDLRPHTEDDLDDMVEFHSDPDVVRYIPWPVRTREETRAALQVRLASGRVEADGEWLTLAMQLRDTGQVIGEVLLKCVDHAAGEGELGFALHSGFHRQGFGFEAAHAMLELAFGPFELRRVVAVLDSRNAASAALLVKLGFRFESVETDQLFKEELVDVATYVLLADDFT
jgi:RimJ/RimL family protein N-acetyltransferase